MKAGVAVGGNVPLTGIGVAARATAVGGNGVNVAGKPLGIVGTIATAANVGSGCPPN